MYPSLPWGFQPWFGPVSYAPPGPGPGLRWGGIGARLGALLIDAVVIACALLAAGMLISALGLSSSSGESEPPGATAVSLVWVLFAMVYHPVCWYLFGATAGQKALGLRLAQAYSGEPLGIGGVLVRYIIFSFVTVVIPLGVISGITASQDPFKRAWHDQIARSVVVRRM